MRTAIEQRLTSQSSGPFEAHWAQVSRDLTYLLRADPIRRHEMATRKRELRSSESELCLTEGRARLNEQEQRPQIESYGHILGDWT